MAKIVQEELFIGISKWKTRSKAAIFYAGIFYETKVWISDLKADNSQFILEAKEVIGYKDIKQKFLFIKCNSETSSLRHSWWIKWVKDSVSAFKTIDGITRQEMLLKKFSDMYFFLFYIRL